MRESLLLLRDLFLNICQQFQKNVSLNVLDDIVNKCNNSVHKTIKMKPIDVTDDSYVESNKDFNKKNP